MKKLLTFCTAIFFVSAANATEYKLDPNHTNITWSANHFGFSNPNGKFNDATGTINFDEKNIEKSSVNVVINIESLVTGLKKFDAHLKSADFFDVDKFPTAKFMSTKVVKTTKNTGKIYGELTLHGITKPVVLDAKLNKKGNHPFTQKDTVGFSATTKIKRSEFDMNYGIPGVSDEVKLTIEVEASVE